jgi:lipopolysaccharide transport system permease protein
MSRQTADALLEPAVGDPAVELPGLPALAQRPRIVITPPRRFGALRFRELWEYRELLYFLTWRDVKVRYKQTFFGAAWAVLQPLLMMAVFALFIGRLAGIQPAGVPYTLFAYTGLVPWTLFAQSLTGASNSLVLNERLVSKVYFPRLLMPIAGAGSFAVDFVIASALLFAMMAYFGRHFSATILLAPVFGVLALLTAVAVGIWLSAVNVRYRDVAFAIPFFVQIWLFATPVAYSLSLVPPRFRVLYGLNPMTGIVVGFRWALLGTEPPPAGTLAVSVATVLVLLPLGLVYFKRAERSFADVI